MIRALYRLVRYLPLKRRTRLHRHMARLGLEHSLSRYKRFEYRHDGRRIAVDVSDHVGREMFKHGWYELAYVEFIRKYFGDSERQFVDVGANVGNYSLALAPHYAHTAAFEPNPVSFSALETNLKLNSSLRITAAPYGLSSVSATLDFYPDDTNNSGASGFERHGSDANPIPLKVIPGDEYFGSNETPVAAIKIDVEGHELAVVEGLRRTIQRDRPVLFMEWHTASMEPYGGLPALTNLLPEEYRLFWSPNKYEVELAPLKPPYKAKYNLIFCIPEERISDAPRGRGSGVQIINPAAK